MDGNSEVCRSPWANWKRQCLLISSSNQRCHNVDLMQLRLLYCVRYIYSLLQLVGVNRRKYFFGMMPSALGHRRDVPGKAVSTGQPWPHGISQTRTRPRTTRMVTGRLAVWLAFCLCVQMGRRGTFSLSVWFPCLGSCKHNPRREKGERKVDFPLWEFIRRTLSSHYKVQCVLNIMSTGSCKWHGHERALARINLSMYRCSPLMLLFSFGDYGKKTVARTPPPPPPHLSQLFSPHLFVFA